MSDLYQVLGVARDVTPEDLKKAYRRLAQKHHPDRDGGDCERFDAIQQAYDVLSDPEDRAQYDETGEVVRKADIIEQAESLLSELFAKAVSSPKDGEDLIAEIREGIELAKREASLILLQIDRKLERLENKRGRIQSRGEHNLFEAAIDEAIEALTNKRRAPENIIRVLPEVLRLLEDYTDTGFETQRARREADRARHERYIGGAVFIPPS